MEIKNNELNNVSTFEANRKVNAVLSMDNDTYDTLLNFCNENIVLIKKAVDIAMPIKTKDKRANGFYNDIASKSLIGLKTNIDSFTLKTVQLLIIFGDDEYFESISDLDNLMIAHTFNTTVNNVICYRLLKEKLATYEYAPKIITKF